MVVFQFLAMKEILHVAKEKSAQEHPGATLCYIRLIRLNKTIKKRFGGVALPPLRPDPLWQAKHVVQEIKLLSGQKGSLIGLFSQLFLMSWSGSQRFGHFSE